MVGKLWMDLLLLNPHQSVLQLYVGKEQAQQYLKIYILYNLVSAEAIDYWTNDAL
jgi:hypothetical protein